MKSIFSKFGISMYNCDCINFMKDKPNNYYDLAFTDPPYNVGRKYNSHNDNMENYYEWCTEWFNELQRISKTQVLTVGYKNIKYWINKNPRHMLIWYKPNQNSPSTIGGFNAYEPIFYFGKLQKRVGNDIIYSNISMQYKLKWHNCPKDLKSWSKILKKIINSPAKIIDPFGGSFTTAIVCYDNNFILDICEIDKKYFQAAKKRFIEHTQISKLI